MIPLHQAGADYVALRQSVGYTTPYRERLLRKFVAFMEKARAGRITVPLALEFAMTGRGNAPKTVAERLSVVRGFARYLVERDPRTEVPPHGLLAARMSAPPPHIYSEDEIRRLLAGAKQYCTPHRFIAGTYHCIIGLLVVTGMRVREVVRLEDQDIYWKEGLLKVRNTKFGKSRWVPIHRSTLRVLAALWRQRDRFLVARGRRRSRPAFFVTTRGTPLSRKYVNRVFLRISRKIGLRPVGARSGPRIHDFRHRFAVETLRRWYQAGDDAGRRLPVLATYLGHAHVSSTFWYLRCTPGLIAAASNRLERRWKGGR
jgi:integrase/recombinase XerD